MAYIFKNKKLFLLITAACTLSSCSSPHDPYKPIASSQLYYCDNNEQIVLSAADQALQAAVSFHGKNFTLSRIETDIDADAFSNGVYTLYYNEDNGVVLEKDGLPFRTGCFPANRKS